MFDRLILAIHKVLNTALGVPVAEAAFATRRAVGSEALAREHARVVWIWPWLDSVRQDVAYAIRNVLQHPGFTSAAVLTLALGIGANTAVFSVVNAVMFRPLQVKDSDRLAVIATARSPTPTLHGVSFPDLQDYRAATSDIFEDIAGYSVGFIGLAPEGGRPARVLVSWVTGNYFPLLGIRPDLGRFIQAGEGQPGRTDPIVVLGYSTWQRRFGGDPSIVGRMARLNGRPCTIVGVTPPTFAGTFAFSESEVYLPLNWAGDGALEQRSARGLHAIGRLRRGVTLGKAQAALSVIAASLEREYPDANAGIKATVLLERLARPEENNARSNALGTTVMLVLVGLVLLVADVNVTNLLLARATTRRKEIAIRAALGAGRGRLIRQLLTEGVILATLGGLAGLCVGTGASRALATLRLPGDLPVRFDFHLDGRVLAYTAAVTTFTSVLVGLMTAWRASRTDVAQTLHEVGRGSMSTTDRHHIRKLLVVAQVAACFVVLVAAGLFTRSLTQAERVDLGFTPDRILNVQMDVAQLGYPEPRGRAFFDDIERRGRAIPGVEELSFAFTVPMGYISVSEPLDVEARPVETGERVIAGKNIVGPRYFATMGMPLIRGRSFTEDDNGRSRSVAIVNERLADLLWPGQNPIGRRFSEAGAKGPWVEVVGVTATGKYRVLFEDPQPYFYVPLAQQYTALRVLHVRTALSPETLAPAVERAIHEAEPDLPLYDVQSMTRALGGGFGFFLVRTGAVFATIFGLLGLVLASVGLYGVVSYMMSARQHEIGVRLALGATSGHVIWMALRRTLTLTAIGVGIGVAAATGVTRVLAGLLYQVHPTDAVAFTSAASLLAAVALMASLVPAWRACRIDPAVVLRES